jgi:adenylate kinase
MRIALFGPPGAGKGTQASILASRHGLVTISTGNLIREAMSKGTELGLEARDFVHKGQLVPGELVRRLADAAILEAGFDRFILDGYPRTIEQGQWLNRFLAPHGAELQAAVFLIVPDEVIIERLSKRRIDRRTGESYHLDFRPPPADLSPENLILRKDDHPEAIAVRLAGYREETKPLKAFFQRKGVLRIVNGACSVEAVNERIMEQLNISHLHVEKVV